MDEMKLAPYPPRLPPQKADFSLKFMVNKTGPSTWVLNAAPHEFFRQNAPPIMWNEISRGETSWGNANGFLKNGSVVDLIIENGAEIDSTHPFHKHNHKVWVIGQGRGGFHWKDVEEAIGGDGAEYFNLVNPPYRDGFTLYGGEGNFVVVRYEINFPAVSMLHCHMIHHFAVGVPLSTPGIERRPSYQLTSGTERATGYFAGRHGGHAACSPRVERQATCRVPVPATLRSFGLNTEMHRYDVVQSMVVGTAVSSAVKLQGDHESW